MFDNAFDQWVAGSAGEKCTFIQILHHTCQRYSSVRKPEFVNCQSKLLGGKTVGKKTKQNSANCVLLIFLSRMQWLYNGRLTAVMLCCKPVCIWLCMMTASTWSVWKCLLILRTQHLLSALLKWGQWWCPTKRISYDSKDLTQIIWFYSTDILNTTINNNFP